MKQDYEYGPASGNLGSIVGLDEPLGALFDRSIYEFTKSFDLECPFCAVHHAGSPLPDLGGL